MSERPLDPDSLRYAEHWEPVLSGPAQRTLDRLATTPGTLLDLGVGTGVLTLAAAQRWHDCRVVGVDASGAMLSVARSRVAAFGHDAGRFEWLTADAADLPRDDGSVDAVASSFMLQLVPDRPAVLAEAWRVLRPGGPISYVTWLANDLVLPADAAYHELLGDVGDGEVDEDEEGLRSPRSGDYVSLEQAREELTAAGFEAVEVVPDELRYAWTADSYLGFKVEYDDRERLGSLAEPQRARLLGTLRERLARLPAEDFVVHGPLVAAVARRPQE